MLLHLKALRDAPEPGPIPHHVEAPPSLSPSSGAKACFGPSSAASSSFSASSKLRLLSSHLRRFRPPPPPPGPARVVVFSADVVDSAAENVAKNVGGSMDDTRVQYISCFRLSHIHSHPYFARLSVLLSSDMMHHDAVSGSSCVACIRRVSRSVPRVRSR
jgi:hypothetical protein